MGDLAAITGYSSREDGERRWDLDVCDASVKLEAAGDRRTEMQVEDPHRKIYNGGPAVARVA